MSWLVAVCFPGLLMLWTVGLQRLETQLHGERPSAAELVARLEAAARTARRRAAQRTLSELSGPQPVARFDPVLLIEEPGLPTCPNPVFQPSASVNGV